MIIRRYFFSFVCLILIICLARASAHAEHRATIISASEYNYPPFSIITEDGKADGFSVELLREALHRVHFNVEFKVGQWSEIKNELRDGKIQVLPLVGRAPEREEIYDFTFHYLTLHGAIFVRKGYTRIETVDDLADKEIIVMKGDSAEEYVNRERISPHIISVEKYEDAMKLLASGKHDAVIAQKLMGIQLLQYMGLSNIVPVDHRLEKFKQEFCFAVQKGDRELLALLNEGLSIVIADGTFDRLHDKWFGPILGPRLFSEDMLKYLMVFGGPAITIILVFFVLMLRREVRRKTEILKKEIEERKKAEDSLKQSSSSLLEAQRLAHIGNWSWIIETDVVEWSSELYAIAGLDPKLPPPSFKEHPALYEKESLERLSKAVELAMTEGKPYELQLNMIQPDGQVIYTSAWGRAIKDKYRRIVRLYGIVQDVTERKKAEEKLRAIDEKFKSLMQQSPFVVELYDLNGLQILVNKAYEELWGFPAETTINKFNVLKSKEVEDTGLMKYVKRAYAGDSVVTPEYSFDPSGDTETKGIGRIRWLSTRIYPLKDESGKVQNIVIVHQDITDRKKLEEELQKFHKLESIGVFAGGIAHDFNNLLSVILTNVYILKMKTDPKSKEYINIESAEKAINRATSLTQQLLTFAKGGAPVKKTESIIEIIEESAEFVLKGSKIKCEYITSDDLWPVEVDEGQINQVIHNLILNASQSMPEGGTIRISMENSTLGSDTGFPLEEGRYVKVSVQDRGTGISEAYLQKIFDPYFTTKEAGRGLGLSITYSIIKQHGGHLTAASKLGVGTTFTIYLPASDKQVAEKETEGETLIAGEGKILLMDDEELIIDATGQVLAFMGYKTVSSKDGNEAIELYKKAMETSEPFDAVILDLTIPGGMGGKETMKKMLEIDPAVKGIVSSGYSNDPVMANFRKYGFSGVIVKPYKTPKQLGEILHKAIKG
ncbi:MAG: transporter substrate-binding domain-containing protein [Candidatus Brocadiales bacterium]|nr:transporter substrate-binding domain-containing protein [Candidatus Brocadiales bacterium]